MTLQEILPLFSGVHGSGKQYSARCPAHDDKHASLSISEGDGGRILFNCHAGCASDAVAAAVGLKMQDLFQTTPTQNAAYSPTNAPAAVEYLYTDINGVPMAKKLRYPNKAFCWLHPDGAGGWEKGRGKIKPLPYNIAAVRDSAAVYIVEGEKDVNTLTRFGKPAVSLPDGAKSKWVQEYGELFTGKHVAIIPDNDEPGGSYAQMIAKELHGKAASVKVLDLSKLWAEIPEHGDITDYVETHPGTDLHELAELVSSTAEQTARGGSRYIVMSGVQSISTDWLWYPYIPLGKITLLTADPGTGKTFFSLYLAATVSAGRSFYGQSAALTSPRAVIYQTAEDGIADTIKPRLEPMKPDFNNIVVIDETNESLSLQECDTIEQAMKDLKPALMIFDPLQAYLGADVDMHRANEVRPVLARIGHLAEQYHCAVLFIMHNSKMGQNPALYRALGSIDIPAIARSMLIMGKNPENPEQKVVCHEKSSLATHGKSLLFRICPESSGIVFDGFSDLTASDVLNVRHKTRNKPSVCQDEVSYRLNELIGEKGFARIEDIKALQDECGCGKGTLYRAKDELQLISKSYGYSKDKQTYWIAPDADMSQLKGQLQIT